MSDRLKVLFVCSRNQWRSPTAEAIYRDDPRMSVRSRGTAKSAARRVRESDLIWADLILVMEAKHRSRLQSDFAEASKQRTIQVLGIADDYSYLDPELIQWIQITSDPLIDNFLSQNHG